MVSACTFPEADNRADNAVAGTHLGQKSAYSEVYDPTLLVAVPRKPNRDNIGVGVDTPWKYAYDVWNCYEVSSLLSNGQPFTGVGKLVYDGNSESIVESKSLKLYFNSFNQTRQSSMDLFQAFLAIKETVERDISNLLKTAVRFNITGGGVRDVADMPLNVYLQTGYGSLTDAYDMDYAVAYDQIATFDRYTHDNSFLKNVYINENDKAWQIYTTSNLFSRCQITNQPDHGNLFIGYRHNKFGISTDDLMQYVASLRGHSCFHEPTVETIFKELYDALQPKELLVAALYTRRGGISIAPVRATHDHLLPYHLINHHIQHVKLPRE